MLRKALLLSKVALEYERFRDRDTCQEADSLISA